MDVLFWLYKSSGDYVTAPALDVLALCAYKGLASSPFHLGCGLLL